MIRIPFPLLKGLLGYRNLLDPQGGCSHASPPFAAWRSSSSCVWAGGQLGGYQD
jgi:hypothetical protein